MAAGLTDHVPHGQLEGTGPQRDVTRHSTTLRFWRSKVQNVTCKTCKVPMKEMKGHIFHKKRKWRCPKCAKVRMQTQKLD
jgi:rubrerythrin